MSSTAKSPVIYFIADLHLAQNRPDITACFLSFLQQEASHAQALYILGDLFEYWIGDDDDSLFIADVANGLSQLNQSGVDIYFIHGNRDFLLGNKYAKKAGMILLPEIDVIDLFGTKTVIMHGDTLCTKDIAYQAFRKKSRSWWWQAIIRSLPLFVRRRIAKNYRQKSAAATAMKAQEIMDVTNDEVMNTFSQYQSPLIIHGHTHRPKIHSYEVNDKSVHRIVLGDWYQQGSLLKFDNNGYQLISRPFTKNCN